MKALTAESATEMRDDVAAQPETPVQPVLRKSFWRAVGLNVKGQKLGEMLVSGGLISADELYAALKEQKETGEQLGKILIRHGVVSAVQVYRKLAEQWCLRATTAGVAMMVQTFAMNPAQAADENNVEMAGLTGQFKLASAVNPAGMGLPKQSQHPSLFGTHEIRSNDISAFKKWSSVIARFEDQMKTQSTTPRVQMWKAEIQKLRHNSDREKIDGVNAYINKVRYIDDSKNYKKSDYWATPIEFFSRGGDCEDFAIAKYASLRALGFSSDQLRIAIVQDKIRNLAHAVLIVYTDDGTFVLDNQNKRVESVARVTRYQPVFSINSDSWWLHKKAIS